MHKDKDTIFDKISAGDALNLRDGGIQQADLRELLSDARMCEIDEFLTQTLETSGVNSALIMQDIVNELGARLGFEVIRGVYRGSRDIVGYDGLWRYNGRSLIVEVKKTDVYGVDLEKLINYGRDVNEARGGNKAYTPERTPVLLVLGKERAEGIESQIRGSRYSEEIRILHVRKLAELAQLKARTTAPGVSKLLKRIFFPMNSINLDGLADLFGDFAASFQWHYANYGESRDNEESKRELDIINSFDSNNGAKVSKFVARPYYSTTNGNRYAFFYCQTSSLEENTNEYRISFHDLSFLNRAEHSFALFMDPHDKQVAIIDGAVVKQSLGEVNKEKDKGLSFWVFKIKWYSEGPKLLKQKTTNILDLEGVYFTDV